MSEVALMPSKEGGSMAKKYNTRATKKVLETGLAVS